MIPLGKMLQAERCRNCRGMVFGIPQWSNMVNWNWLITLQ